MPLRFAVTFGLLLFLPLPAWAASGGEHPAFGPILFSLGVLVVLAKFAGLLSERLGQPSVLGELLVGILLGNAASPPGVVWSGVNRLAVGIGMVPRGEVGLIFAGIGSGLTLGGTSVISPPVFSAIVVMVLVTTLVAPVGLRWAFRRNERGA